MNRRWFLQKLGFASATGAAAITLSSLPVFGKNEAGEEVISLPMILTRAEVEHAGLTRNGLPSLLKRKVDTCGFQLGLMAADRGWLRMAKW